MFNFYITDLNVIKLYCLYLCDLILYKGTKGMASKKKKAEIKRKKALEHKHRMKRKDVWRCVSKRAMTPDFTWLMRIRFFLTWVYKWYLHQGSSLQHSFHPKLDHSATTLGEKDLQNNNDLKLVNYNVFFGSLYIIATGIYSICVYFFRWMFCMTPMCHQVRYQELCPPFVRMTKEPFFPRLFSTSPKKARAYWT